MHFVKIFTFVLLLCWSSGAGAFSFEGTPPIPTAKPSRPVVIEVQSRWMATSIDYTSQPIGHYKFCRQYPAECRKLYTSEPVVLTNKVLDLIIKVNLLVNRQIKPMDDLENYGQEEFWAYPVLTGDCEDYALLKRRMLIEKGFDPSILRLVVARRPNGEGHAGLILRTKSGDLFLDNLVDRIMVWNKTPYNFLKMQSAIHAGKWVKILTTKKEPDEASTVTVEPVEKRPLAPVKDTGGTFAEWNAQTTSTCAFVGRGSTPYGQLHTLPGCEIK